MSSSFAGLVALVTGGGSGIGRALALALAREGAKVVVTDINHASAAEAAAAITAAGSSALALPLDVTSREDWNAAVSRVERELGPIDVLCSNAGARSCRRPLTEVPAEYVRWMFEVNVMSGLHAIQAVASGMKARGRGWILFTGSMAGFSSEPEFGDYCASKHALLAIADSLRKEFDGSGVAVSYLCPSSVETNFAETTRALLDPAIADLLPPEEASANAVAAAGDKLSADTVAAIALAGLRRGQFVVPTHAQSDHKAERRYNELRAALDALARS